jgi:hypothetical protein
MRAVRNFSIIIIGLALYLATGPLVAGVAAAAGIAG